MLTFIQLCQQDHNKLSRNREQTVSTVFPRFVIVFAVIQVFRLNLSTLKLSVVLITLHALQRSSLPVFGISRYQARYSSRALRFASSKSRLSIGLTTLAALTADRAVAEDAMTAERFTTSGVTSSLVLI